MSNRSHTGPIYLAPGATSSALPERAIQLPGADTAHGDTARPAVLPPDEHLVEPETYQQMIDGQILELTPAEPPHADQQFNLVYALGAHVADDYIGSTELLTRVSEDNDFATDACIRRRGHDSGGHRHLEELSFEVKHKQSEASLRKRARTLIERGVRRVFAVYVQVDNRGTPDSSDSSERVLAGPVKEWSTENDDWIELARDSFIEDPCLRRPLKVGALIEAVEADNAVVQALNDKGNPLMLQLKSDSYDQGKSDGYDQGKTDGYDQGKTDGYDQGKTDGYDQGKTDGYDQGKFDGYDQGESDGLRRAIRILCQGFEITLTPEHNARLESLDADGLQAVLVQLQTHRTWDLNLRR